VKILFTGAIFDSSGYAEASRNYIDALILQPDIELSVKFVSFEQWKTDHKSFQERVNPYLNKKIGEPDVHIIHLTPENYSRVRVPAKKTIGYTVWETDKLPDSWVTICNQLDEIWVPCDWNVEVCKASGITVPVKKIPHCINTQEFENVNVQSEITEQYPNDTFKFYSIFQWSARKNPEALLKAYLTEFNESEKVSLVLKTYYINNSQQDKNQIVDAIKRIKQDLQLNSYPSIYLLHGSMSRDQILTIHNDCDCFVLPHRAEGWGVPHFEALAMANPVIATGYGGNLEFMQLANSWFLNFNITPVSGMGRQTYHGKMNWAEPHLDSLKRCMREAFSNRELVESKGQAGKLKVQNFSHQVVGEQIIKLLRESLNVKT
jgi:glycosyltransferase involved in cell wall biosynthesis